MLIEIAVAAPALALIGGLVAYLRQSQPGRLRSLEDAERAQKSGEAVTGRVTGAVGGGLKIDIGLPAFLPVSSIDVGPVEDLDAYVGRKLRVRLILVNKRLGNIVVSRKSVLKSEAAEREARVSEAIKIRPDQWPCYEVTFTDKEGTVSGLIEPEPGGRMLIWENEFNTHPKRRKRIVKALCAKLNSERTKYRVFWDQDRLGRG